MYSLLYMRVKMLMWLAAIAPKRKWSICCIMFLHKNESCYLDMAQTKGYTLLYIHSHEVYANAKGVRRHMHTESPASNSPAQYPWNECTKQRERSEEKKNIWFPSVCKSMLNNGGNQMVWCFLMQVALTTTSQRVPKCQRPFITWTQNKGFRM